MNKHQPKGYILPCALTIAAALLLWLLSLKESVELNREMAWQDYSTLFTNMFFISLLTERFIEMFLGVVRIEGKQEIQRNIDYASNDSAKQKAERSMDQYRSVTARRAMQIAYTAGLFVSLSGVRSLQPIVDATGLVGVQASLFSLTDILLTAGLIAGGSNGVNKVTSVFARHLEQVGRLSNRGGASGSTS